jgi:hypothetical protein
MNRDILISQVRERFRMYAEGRVSLDDAQDAATELIINFCDEFNDKVAEMGRIISEMENSIKDLGYTIDKLVSGELEMP